jgi:uncharacterized repeat protein (TIGR01451 family)
MSEVLFGFAQEVTFSAERTPRLDQAGWLGAQETARSVLSARRRGGRLNSRTNSLSNLVDRPVRSRQGGFAAFLLVASTPPDPGGEFPRLRIDFLCQILLLLAVLMLSAVPANGQFRVQKISTDVTGDPNALRAGDTLYYTITVQNIGNENATNVVLRDAVPVNTIYVAGSTTLNGGTVSDSGNFSPLVYGMPIHSPANPTPGLMLASPASNQANVATITFSVVVDPGVINGTVISNQSFVTAASNGIVDYPSDDPDTPIINDPTRDIAGSMPLLYAEKRVALSVDLGSPGIVDPGDVVRYTITVQNSAATAATGVIVRDSVPGNTTYVENSTRLNGGAFGQPDGGVSPLTAGLNVGTIAARTTAVVQFDLRVNAGTPAGTMIRNQAVVDSVELSDVLTDGDGNPATRPEPTVVIVGDGQQLSITKQVVVVGGGAALPRAQLEYVIRVENISAVPALNVVITDNLDGSQPGQLVYVSGSATMNGTVNGRTGGVTVAGSTITANYTGPLDPGAFVVLRFRAALASSLADATVVTNTGVVTWNQTSQTASAAVSVIVGGVPGTTILNGFAWHDANFNAALDLSEEALENWVVDLFRDGRLLHSMPTDDVGVYRFVGVEPNDASGSGYEVRFRAPAAGPNTAMLGIATSPFTNGMQRIMNIVVSSGANLRGLNLPIQPNGVVYHSIQRTEIAGAVLTMLDARTARPLPSGCFDDAAQQGQVTPQGGYYRFDVNFSDSACPTGGNYVIRVAGATFAAGYSLIIRPTSDASTTAFDVPACPGGSVDAIPGTTLICEVQNSELPPGTNVPPGAGTIYHVHLRLDGTRTPGSSQLFNNHIPLDPQPEGSLSISKTTPLRDVTRGQLVPYTITLNNVRGAPVTDVTIVDRFPAGFTYIAGSALLDGVPTEPSIVDRTLSWNGLVVTETQVRTVRLLLAVGAGVNEGEYVNRAQAMIGTTGLALTGEVTATVRTIPDPTFDCTDVTGKVFNDANRNGRQDDGEDGLAGVRVVTPRGLQATTDKHGRYHITCALIPNENRGSNFVLKLDDRTLPSGFRMSTDSLQIKRVTRGKAVPFNFGASLHRVVAIDLSDAAFEPGKTDIRVQWQPRLNLLLDELRKAPAILRLSYVGDTEEEGLVERRIKAIKSQLTKAWGSPKNNYALTIEPEVFWRRGGPPKR